MTVKQISAKYKPSSQKLGKKKKPNIASLFLIGLGLTGVSLMSATAGAIIAVSLSTTPLRQSKLTPDEAKVFSQDQAISYGNLQLPELSRPVNILVLGVKVLTSDQPGYQPEKDPGYQALVNSFKGLSDTMLLLRFDPSTKKLTLLSIPRDTQATINVGKGIQKINEANNSGGPALAAEAVSELLAGVPIDRYVRVNVQGVEKVIDALGGVNVYVPKDMKYQDDSQHLYINLKQGEQHLDGAKAVGFLRFRHDRYGDIGRVQRQQMFMRALVEQSLKPQTILKMPEILSVIGSHIDTNLTVEELLALTGFASQTKRADVKMLMLPGGFNGDGRHGVSYWLPNPVQIQNMVAEHFGHGQEEVTQTDIDPTRLRIAIQDSTENPEAVQQMVRFLREAGYRRVFVSDQWSEPVEKTRIVAQSGDDMGASALRAKLGVGEILVESTGTLTSDITIVLGKDWQQPDPSSPLPYQKTSDTTSYR